MNCLKTALLDGFRRTNQVHCGAWWREPEWILPRQMSMSVKNQAYERSDDDIPEVKRCPDAGRSVHCCPPTFVCPARGRPASLRDAGFG